MLLPRLLRPKGKNGERGQALAEFALVAPIFLMLVFAIVDFGMGFHAWITVTNSAREGARLGSVQATQSQIVTRVQQTADTLVQSKLTVAVTNAQGTPGQSVTVKVDYTYDLITPLAGIVAFISGDVIGPTLNFSSTAEMRLE